MPFLALPCFCFCSRVVYFSLQLIIYEQNSFYRNVEFLRSGDFFAARIIFLKENISIFFEFQNFKLPSWLHVLYQRSCCSDLTIALRLFGLTLGSYAKLGQTIGSCSDGMDIRTAWERVSISPLIRFYVRIYIFIQHTKPDELLPNHEG